MKESKQAYRHGCLFKMVETDSMLYKEATKAGTEPYSPLESREHLLVSCHV